MFEILVISLLRRLMVILNIFLKVLGPLFDRELFATLQIELYCIVDYDSKWSTKFHKDCMFEILVISLLRRLMIIFKHLKKVLGPMFDRELLQHSKLKCTV